MVAQTEQHLEDVYREMVDDGASRPEIMLPEAGATFHHVALPCAVLSGRAVTFEEADLRGADLRGVAKVRLVRCTLKGTELPEFADIVDCDIQD